MILALETATTACSAALCAADGSVVAERVSLDGPAHSRLLLPFVREVMGEAGADWADLSTVAVGLGPGAFTGLRIGVATARSLAQADGRLALAGAPTPTALALALADDARGRADVRGAAGGLAAGAAGEAAAPRRVVPMIDGRRREVFAAVYDVTDAGVTPVTDVAVVPADGLAGWLEEHGPALTGGDGAALYAHLLPATVTAVAGVVAPTAAMVARAVAVGAPGVVLGPDAVLPLYGRAPDAARWTSAAAGPRAQAGEARP